jgi:carboxylate-amine ligase
LDAKLFDAEAGKASPAREVIEKLLSFARPSLEDGGDWEEVSTLVHETLEHGNGANRQRRAYEKTGRLGDVVDMLITTTRSARGSLAAREHEPQPQKRERRTGNPIHPTLDATVG